MIRTILVPLDGSTFGEHALPWALNIARRAKASVQLLYVHRPLEATYAEMQIFDSSLDQKMREHEKAYLAGVQKNAASVDAAPVTSVTLEGEVAATIRQHVAESGIDLIVMTTHARGPMGRFWLGSVADELLRDLPAPVLVVHPQEKRANLGDDLAFKNILIPLDGTPLAEQILAPAVHLAKLTGASVTLLRVIKPVMKVSLPAGTGSFGEMSLQMMQRLDEIQDQLKKEALEYLARIAVGLQGQGLAVQTHIALEEQPGLAILHHAQPPVDLIALETHGRRGLSRLFLGSVADKVIRGTPVPVLVHRPKGK